jgi:hypothetical protein
MAKMVTCFICKKQVQKDLTIQLSTPEGKQPVCLTHPGVQVEQQKPKIKK